MSEPHRPHRDDDVSRWLERRRYEAAMNRPAWETIDRLLTRYRECADYGLTLMPEDDHRGDP